MSANWNLPDGCHPFDVPGNSRADLMRETMTPAAVAQAREELIVECRRQTRTHAHYLDYVSAHGIVSHRQFVRMLESSNSDLWSRKFEAILQDLISGGDAA